MKKCSIIVPVYNRPALTNACLNALLSDHVESVETEIIVVDDGSELDARSFLESLDGRVQVLFLEANSGFAAACNRGAAAANGDFLVFLNNDVTPAPGWLDALIAHAASNPRAGIVGSKLLFPDGTVQHCGIVIGIDRNPHHLYLGFPGEHPAANKSRTFQAVTGACMLVWRHVFEKVGGFDRGFRNGYEDVDFCLRVGQLGFEVHYSHRSRLTHLESVTRGERSEETKTGLRRYRKRWADFVEPDDFMYYIDDGLLRIGYGREYPVRIQASPLLATADSPEAEMAKLLSFRTRQASDLLKETIRLTVQVQELEFQRWFRTADRDTPAPPNRSAADALDREFALRHDAAACRLHDLQEAFSDVLRGAGKDSAFQPSPHLGYRKLLARIREAVADVLPADGEVIVISHGDDELVGIFGGRGLHFPRSDNGEFAGFHPASSADAIRELEELHGNGGRYLLIPETSLWWLDHYDGFRQHLNRYRILFEDRAVCLIFALSEPR